MGAYSDSASWASSQVPEADQSPRFGQYGHVRGLFHHGPGFYQNHTLNRASNNCVQHLQSLDPSRESFTDSPPQVGQFPSAYEHVAESLLARTQIGLGLTLGASSPLFCCDFLRHLNICIALSQYLFEPTVFLFEPLQPPFIVSPHVARPLAPCVDKRLAHPVAFENMSHRIPDNSPQNSIGRFVPIPQTPHLCPTASRAIESKSACREIPRQVILPRCVGLNQGNLCQTKISKIRKESRYRRFSVEPGSASIQAKKQSKNPRVY